MPSYLSHRDGKEVRKYETVTRADPLGSGSGCRFESFGLLVGQGQHAVGNGGWTCAQGNLSMADAVVAGWMAELYVETEQSGHSAPRRSRSWPRRAAADEKK